MSSIIIICAVAVVCFAGYAAWKNRKKQSAAEDVPASDDAKNTDEFSKAFFERAQAGETAQQFLQLSNQTDCALLQGMLQSAGIPSYTDFTHINKFYGPLTEATPSGLSIRLQILINDYDDALAVVNDYTKTKGSSAGITVYPKQQ
ncbi:MAG TPA: hypothetical protein DCL73_01490 [Treponema sp.]|nr:hypothetical protein [Treponema sp.]